MARRFMLVTICLIFSVSASPTEAQNKGLQCPNTQPSRTLYGLFSQSTDVILISLQSSKQPTEKKNGQTVFQVLKVVKFTKETLQIGNNFTLPRSYHAKKGTQFIRFGKRSIPFGKWESKLEWFDLVEVTDASFKYIVNSPSPKASKQQRLSYFLEHLENTDPVISNDAYTEFSVASYEDLYTLRKNILREKVCKWVSSSKTSPTRLALYGQLLGLSGNKEDAEMMEKIILRQTKDFRIGIDGIMAGYLLLKGEAGLKVLEETKLKNKKAAFSETYGAMQALRFLWNYEPKKIPKARMKQSMRILLDRAEIADLVIADLTRWEDWSILDHLMKMYEEKEFDIPAIKREIIIYMLACTRSHGNRFGDPPEYIEKARTNLVVLRWENPKIYEDIERYYYEK